MKATKTITESLTNPIRPTPRLRIFLMGIVTFLALVTGVYSLRYALPHVPAPAPLPNFVNHRSALVIHAVCASVALLVGPWQFSAALRRNRLSLHRVLGRIYLSMVATAWLFSLPIALGALGGSISTVGFLCLGGTWIVSSSMGLVAILQRRITDHRDWMIRSYALTAAGITLRLYVVFVIATHLPFVESYRAISWLCWVPNLLFAEFLIWQNRSRQQKAPVGVEALRIGPGF